MRYKLLDEEPLSRYYGIMICWFCEVMHQPISEPKTGQIGWVFQPLAHVANVLGLPAMGSS